MAITTLTDSGYDALFKRVYLKLGDNLYSTYDNFDSQAKKTFGTIGGKDAEFPIEVTFGGGVGSSTDGTLPEAYHTEHVTPVLTAKRVYARIQIDGLTIESSEKSEHAFVKAVDQETIGKLRSFNRRNGAIWMNDGTGILGQFSGNASGTAAAPYMTILTTGTYRRRKHFFEKGDYVNVNTLSSVFRIVSYVHSTGVLTLARVSGSDDLTGIGGGTHSIYWQNSKDADPYGLLGIFANGTHYGVTEEYRYAPPQRIDASGAPLDTAMLTELCEKHDEDTDVSFTDLVFSPVQYRKYISLLEDQKRFPVPVDFKPRANDMTSPELIARVAFGGIQYVGSTGNIKCWKNKFVRDDMVIGVNMREVEAMHVKKPGWRARDEMIFLRMEDKDAYEARYVCYKENRINPFHVSFLYGLDIT